MPIEIRELIEEIYPGISDSNAQHIYDSFVSAFSSLTEDGIDPSDEEAVAFFTGKRDDTLGDADPFWLQISERVDRTAEVFRVIPIPREPTVSEEDERRAAEFIDAAVEAGLLSRGQADGSEPLDVDYENYIAGLLGDLLKGYKEASKGRPDLEWDEFLGNQLPSIQIQTQGEFATAKQLERPVESRAQINAGREQEFIDVARRAGMLTDASSEEDISQVAGVLQAALDEAEAREAVGQDVNFQAIAAKALQGIPGKAQQEREAEAAAQEKGATPVFDLATEQRRNQLEDEERERQRILTEIQFPEAELDITPAGREAEERERQAARAEEERALRAVAAAGAPPGVTPGVVAAMARQESEDRAARLGLSEDFLAFVEN